MYLFMLKLKKYVICVVLVITIFHNNYCDAHTNTVKALNENIIFKDNYKKHITTYFFHGLKDGLLLSCIWFAPVFFMLPIYKNKADDLIDNYLQINRINGINEKGLLNIRNLLFIEPFLFNLLDYVIIYSVFTSGLSCLVPASLSNKNTYKKLSYITTNYIDNRIFKKLMQKAENHFCINSQSTSFIVEILTTFILTNLIMLIVSNNENKYSGILHAMIYFCKVNHYIKNGYLNTAFYNSALNIALSSSSTLLLILAYIFKFKINIHG